MNLNLGGFDPSSLMNNANPLLAFARLPEDQREKYLDDHPELLNEGLVGAALNAAGLADPATRKQIASGALQIAKQLGNQDLIKQAQGMLGRRSG